MNFLAMETVFDQCSVAIIDDKQNILAASTITGKRQQSQQILPMIETSLHQAGLTLAQMSALIFNQGPGAFSGIRINTAVTQALAVAHDLPCVGVSSLQAIAQSAFEEFGVTHLYSALDARMQQVYFGEYQLESKSQIMAPNLANDLASEASKLFDSSGERLLDYEAKTALNFPLCGNGAPFLASHSDQAIFAEINPDAVIIVKLGAAKFMATGGVNAELALPNYLRNHAWKTLKEQGKA